MLGIPESKIRVIAPDVGGGFGSKIQIYGEGPLAIALARRLGRPVKWTEERAENYVGTIHGRDVVHELTFAATKDGDITAVKSEAWCAMGAYLELVDARHPAPRRVDLLGAVRDPQLQRHVHGRLHEHDADRRVSRSRQAGGDVRPRADDGRARDASSAWIPSSFGARTSSRSSRTRWRRASPSTRATTTQRSTGCSSILDLDAIRADQAARRASGDAKQIGVGFSTYNEMCGLAPSRILGAIRYAVGGWDASTVRFQPLGSVQVVTGTSPHGQSHETTFAQIVADQLGVGVDDVEVIHGDTASSQLGMDTYGSRSLAVGGVALWHAGEKVIAKARQIVAHQLEVSEDDLEFENGTFSVKGSPDRSMTIQAAAFAAHSAHDLPDGMEPGLEATAVYDPPNFSWPAGAHAAVVEVDTETGDTRLVRYVAVDDVGNARQPADHRRAGARRRHAGHRARRCTRRARTTRRATSSRRRWRPTSSRRRRSCRRSRPTAPRPRPTTRSA